MGLGTRFTDLIFHLMAFYEYSFIMLFIDAADFYPLAVVLGVVVAVVSAVVAVVDEIDVVSVVAV